MLDTAGWAAAGRRSEDNQADKVDSVADILQAPPIRPKKKIAQRGISPG